MKRIISILFAIAAVTLAAMEENLKAFTLYDPAKDGIKGKVWTFGVKKPDDMKANFAIVNGIDGRKTLEISYTGTNAKAYSSYSFFNCPKKLLPDEWSLVAIRLTAECDRDLPLRGGIRLPNKKNSNFRVLVPNGLNEIVIRPPRAGYSGRLTIPSIGFWYANGVTWRVYKIEILAEKFQLKELPLTFHRNQMIEILPVSVPAKMLTGVSSDPAAPKDSLSVKLSYSDKELNVSLKSRFSSQPAAEAEKHDSGVWMDESQEIFFSPACDNRERYQFTCNARGTIYDSKLGFDQTAAAVVNNVGFTMPHTKKLSYEGNFLTGEYRFPFSALGFLPERDRFMSGLFGQTWKKPASFASVPEMRDAKKSFINLKNYALLVFNRQPFGSGSISVERAGFLRGERELRLTWKTADVAPGKYKMELRLVRPTFDKIIKTASVAIPCGGSSTGDFYITGTFPAGNYTAYFLLTNSNGDSIVSGADFSYAPPMKQREDLVLFPTPKKLIWKKGSFNLADGNGIQIPSDATEITKRTVRQWAERLARVTGKLRKSDTAPANIEFRIIAGKPQSYTLSVTPEKLIVTGGDEAGLYYGARTVLKLWQGTMKVLPGRPIPCCEISDYPDIAIRPVHINLPKAVAEYARDQKIREYEPMDYWIDYCDRFVAGNGYNVLLLDPSRLLKFKSHPEMDEVKDAKKRPLVPCGLYSMEEMMRLAEFCRDNFIELIPVLNYCRDGFSDRGCGLARFKLYHYYYDTENPEYNRIYFDLVDELIDTVRKVMPLRFFCVSLDEFMIFKPEIGGKYDPVGRLEKAIPRLYAHLKEKKVGMMIYPDTFNPYSARPFDFTKVIDTIPRDVVLLHWENGSVPVRYFSKKGFKVWALGTGLQTFDDDAKKRLSAYGRALYERGFSWMIYDDGKEPFMSMNALFHAADYGWNLFHPIPGYVDQLTEGTIQKARQTAAVRGCGNAGVAVPIPLDKVFNNDLAKYAERNFPGSKPEMPKTAVSEIGNVPMQLSNRFVMLSPGSELDVPIDRKAESVILLTASHVNPSAIHRNYALLARSIYCGIPAGEFLVKYTDGSIAEIPMRLHKNYDFIDQNPVLRASLDCRYALLLPAGEGRYFTLHQYEWINPHPEKTIKSLGYRHKYPVTPFGFKVTTPIMLFAVTCRDCGK